MDHLSPDEVKFLCCVPPFLCEYSEIIIKHFGSTPPQKAWQILEDFLSLQENFHVLQNQRRIEIQEQQINMQHDDDVEHTSTEESSEEAAEEEDIKPKRKKQPWFKPDYMEILERRREKRRQRRHHRKLRRSLMKTEKEDDVLKCAKNIENMHIE